MRIKLMVTAGPNEGTHYTFDSHDTFLVGRAVETHFRLPETDKYFSRMHFLVEVNPPLCRLIDMGSHNGTFVNGERVQTATLRDGDLIQGGTTTLRVSIEAPDQAPAITQTLHGVAGILQSPEERVAVGVQAEIGTPRPSSTEPTKESFQPAPAAAAVHPLLAGKAVRLPTVPGYRIERQLGKGGMGTVYQARRESDNRAVALKVILPPLEPREKDVRRFLREANILKNLSHPNIVTFYDLGGTVELFWFAMELVSGTDLATTMKAEGPLDMHRSVGLVCQILDALAYAHREGFIHRDLKPANLLLTTVDGYETLKLADFGLARTYQASQVSGLTMEGDVGGTARFMPPEQIVNFRAVQPSADQYAAASTLYHLLTNAYTYDCQGGVHIQLKMLLLTEPVPIRNRRPDLPEKLAAVIHKAMARQPEQRYADVVAFRTALLPFMRGR
jgi:serine/threonine-protein kinase